MINSGNITGNRIAEFAKLFYGSQKKFAIAIGISPQHLHAYVKKKSRKPGYEILEKFHQSGMSINWLISGTGKMTADNSIGKILENGLKEHLEGGNVKEVGTSSVKAIPVIKNYEGLKILMKEAISEVINEKAQED